jgi:signal transduction histidine kinase
MLRGVSRSIRQKLALMVLATTLTALLVAGIALVVYDLRLYRQAGISDLMTQADIVGRASAAALAFDDPRAATENLLTLKAKPGITSAAIYNAKGRIFARYRSGEPSGDPGRANGSDFPILSESEGARIEDDHFVVFKRIVQNDEILGTVYLQANYEARGRLFDYLGIFGAVMLGSLLIAAAIFAWLQAVLTRPILEMAEVTRRIGASRDFSLRMKKTTEDELGRLADSFNAMLAEVGQRSEALEASNLSLAREMAERRKADAELQQLNLELEKRVADRTHQLEAANRELEGFSYSVSHDLRAPLRSLIGFSAMLEEEHGADLDSEARRKLSVIQKEAQRMGVLTDSLLSFSQLGRASMKLGDIDMTGLARETFDGLTAHLGAQQGAQRTGPQIEFRLASLPRGRGDRVLFGQVWTNLIANAIKFTARREQPLIEVSAISDDKENVYFVRDNGAGFDPRYQSKLFGVFQRLHHADEFPGTGVGLALVQRIVERHGGRVWAEGQPDAGATFYFAIPKARPKLQA